MYNEHLFMSQSRVSHMCKINFLTTRKVAVLSCCFRCPKLHSSGAIMLFWMHLYLVAQFLVDYMVAAWGGSVTALSFTKVERQAQSQVEGQKRKARTSRKCKSELRRQNRAFRQGQGCDHVMRDTGHGKSGKGHYTREEIAELVGDW